MTLAIIVVMRSWVKCSEIKPLGDLHPRSPFHQYFLIFQIQKRQDTDEQNYLDHLWNHCQKMYGTITVTIGTFSFARRSAPVIGIQTDGSNYGRYFIIYHCDCNILPACFSADKNVARMKTLGRRTRGDRPKWESSQGERFSIWPIVNATGGLRTSNPGVRVWALLGNIIYEQGQKAVRDGPSWRKKLIS